MCVCGRGFVGFSISKTQKMVVQKLLKVGIHIHSSRKLGEERCSPGAPNGVSPAHNFSFITQKLYNLVSCSSRYSNLKKSQHPCSAQFWVVPIYTISTVYIGRAFFYIN